jgi:hypothetical protein
MEHDNRVFFFGCTIVTGRGVAGVFGARVRERQNHTARVYLDIGYT